MFLQAGTQKEKGEMSYGIGQGMRKMESSGKTGYGNIPTTGQKEITL